MYTREQKVRGIHLMKYFELVAHLNFTVELDEINITTVYFYKTYNLPSA